MCVPEFIIDGETAKGLATDFLLAHDSLKVPPPAAAAPTRKSQRKSQHKSQRSVKVRGRAAVDGESSEDERTECCHDKLSDRQLGKKVNRKWERLSPHLKDRLVEVVWVKQAGQPWWPALICHPVIVGRTMRIQALKVMKSKFLG